MFAANFRAWYTAPSSFIGRARPTRRWWLYTIYCSTDRLRESIKHVRGWRTGDPVVTEHDYGITTSDPPATFTVAAHRAIPASDAPGHVVTWVVCYLWSIRGRGDDDDDDDLCFCLYFFIWERFYSHTTSSIHNFGLRIFDHHLEAQVTKEIEFLSPFDLRPMLTSDHLAPRHTTTLLIHGLF